MPGMASHAAFIQKQMVKRRNTFGTSFQNLRTGIFSTGIENLMALNDFPQLRMEYDAKSANELNPVVLDCIDPALDLKVGDYLIYPYVDTSSEYDFFSNNRMRVSAVQPVTLSGVEVRRFILCYNAAENE